MKKLKLFGAGLSSVLMSLAVGVVPAFATEAVEEGTGVADFLQDGDKSGGVFSKLIEKVKSLGQDAYQLLMVIGIVGLVASILVLAISTSLTKKEQARTENKSWAVNIAIGACVLFGALSIVGIFASIGSGI